MRGGGLCGGGQGLGGGPKAETEKKGSGRRGNMALGGMRRVGSIGPVRQEERDGEAWRVITRPPSEDSYTLRVLSYCAV